MTFHAIATFFFLFLNIFFVLTEFSLVKSQIPRLEVMKSQGKNRAGLVLAMMRNMDNYLSAIQVGVTIGTLGLGWAAEPVLSRSFENLIPWPSVLAPFANTLTAGISFLIVVYCQIVFAELLPRSIAIQRAEDIACWVALPLQAYYHVFRLPIAVMAKSSIFLLGLIGLKPVGEHKEVFTEEEVRVLLGMSQEKGLMPLDQLLLIENLFDLADLKVKDAMVPREKIAFLSIDTTWAENLSVIKSHHFSRYPVIQGNLDLLLGYIHLKDLVSGKGTAEGMLLQEPVDLKKIVRPLTSVEDSLALYPLLKVMSSQGKHMLSVTRAGRTVGIITQEDVIEELLGEILDEFDAPNAWSFHNLLSVDAINLDLRSETLSETVRTMATQLQTVHPGLDLNLVEKQVLAREAQLPTAIGKGVAVPHARIPGLSKPLVAIGRTEKADYFITPDKKPVHFVFLLLTPASSPLDQLRILARIATLAHNDTLMKQLQRAKNPAQFLEIIQTSEAILAG